MHSPYIYVALWTAVSILTQIDSLYDIDVKYVHYTYQEIRDITFKDKQHRIFKYKCIRLHS